MSDKKTQINSKKRVKVVQPVYPDFENSWIFEELDTAVPPEPVAPKIEC